MLATQTAFSVHSISLNGLTYVSTLAPSGEIIFAPEGGDNYSYPIPLEDILPSLVIGLEAGYPDRGYTCPIEARRFPNEPSFWVLSRVGWTSSLQQVIEPVIENYERLEKFRAALMQ